VPNPAFVQVAHIAFGPASSGSVSFGSNTAAGNLLVIAVFGGVTPVTVADTQGNVWNWVGWTRMPSGARSMTLFYAYNCVGGADTITVTSNGADNFDLIAVEYANLQTVVDPLDVTSTALGNSASMNSGNVTTTAAEDLLVDVLNASNNGIAVTDGSTVRFNAGFGSWVVSDQDIAVPSTVAATATCNAGGWGAQVAAFLAFLAGTVATSPGFVQAKATPATGVQASIVATYAFAQVAGDTNVVFVNTNTGAGNPVASVVDTSGNTYVFGGQAVNAGGTVSSFAYYALGIKAAAAGTNTVTVTFGSSVSTLEMFVAEYARAGTFIGAFTNTGNSTTASVTFTLAGLSNQMVVASAGTLFGLPTPGAGYRQRALTVFGSIQDLLEDNLTPSAGSNTAAENLPSSAQWSMVALVFQTTPPAPPAAGTLLGGVVG
jgi:hypothetical protein